MKTAVMRRFAFVVCIFSFMFTSCFFGVTTRVGNNTDVSIGVHLKDSGRSLPTGTTIDSAMIWITGGYTDSEFKTGDNLTFAFEIPVGKTIEVHAAVCIDTTASSYGTGLLYIGSKTLTITGDTSVTIEVAQVTWTQATVDVSGATLSGSQVYTITPGNASCDVNVTVNPSCGVPALPPSHIQYKIWKGTASNTDLFTDDYTRTFTQGAESGVQFKYTVQFNGLKVGSTSSGVSNLNYNFAQ